MVGNGTYGQVYKVCFYLFSELKRGVSDCVTRDECVARERAEVRIRSASSGAFHSLLMKPTSVVSVFDSLWVELTSS